MKKILLVLLSVIALSGGACALPSQESLFFDNLKQKTLSILQADNLQIEHRQALLEKIIKESTAIFQIGRSVMGTSWRQLSTQHQREYSDVFAQWLVITLAKRLAGFELQGDIVVLQKHQGTNGILVISTEVETHSQGRVAVDWYVRKIGGVPKLINVSIANVSMISTQRSEFAVIYGKNGFIGLLHVMRQQIQENKVQGEY